MDLTDLRHLQDRCRGGRHRQGGRTPHRVQSNVTTRIKQLEASIGVPLFVREKQRLHLSPQGGCCWCTQTSCCASPTRQRALSELGPLRGARCGSARSKALLRADCPNCLAIFINTIRMSVSNYLPERMTSSYLLLSIVAWTAAFVAESPNRDGISHVPAFAEQLVLITAGAHRQSYVARCS